jgi:uncharacterized membrane protein
MLDAFLMALAAAVPLQEPAKVEIEWWPFTDECGVDAMSSDGTWAAGTFVRSGIANVKPFRWSAPHGLEPLKVSKFVARAISDDGQRVLTRAPTYSPYSVGKTILWTPTGLHYFPGGTGFSHAAYSEGHAMSRDGRFAAGWSMPDSVLPNGTFETAWIWDTFGGSVQFLTSSWGGDTRALDVSDDGRVAVGFAEHSRWFNWNTRWPALWTEGTFEVLGNGIGEAFATSSDGRFVTGQSNARAFLWDRARGMRYLEMPELIPTGFPSGFRGIRVSDDGSTLVACQYSNYTFFESFVVHCFLWREGAGAVEMRALLSALGAEVPEEVISLGFLLMGPDGRTFLGGATMSTHPSQTTWIGRAVLPPAAEVYCTSQTSVGGCTPSIGFAGTPSARTGEGFPITVHEVPQDARGVLAYGTSGWASVPFGGGVLCVAEPTTRVALGPAVGAQACEGALAIDFNAVVAAAADPALIGGAHVWAQAWMRDLAAPPPQLLLSDALVFTLWP